MGRSWADLGPVLGSFLVVLYWFLYYFVEIDVFEKNRLKTCLGPILGRFGSPRGVQDKAFGDLSWGTKVSRSGLGRSQGLKVLGLKVLRSEKASSWHGLGGR